MLSAACGELLAFDRYGHAEIDATVVVCLLSGGQVEVGKRNLLGVLLRKDPQGLSHDGVVLDLFFTLVTKKKNCGRQRFAGLFRTRPRRRRWRIDVLVRLRAHSLFIQTLGVHVVRYANLAITIVVVRGTRIPPPGRIERVAIPRPAKSESQSEPTATAEAEAVISKSIPEGPAAKTIAKMIIEVARTQTCARDRATGKSVRDGSRAKDCAAMTTAKTVAAGVTRKATAGRHSAMTACRTVHSAMLRGKR